MNSPTILPLAQIIPPPFCSPVVTSRAVVMTVRIAARRVCLARPRRPDHLASGADHLAVLLVADGRRGSSPTDPWRSPPPHPPTILTLPRIIPSSFLSS
jgi:hypothetical protein